ncbi:uncharacterized protein LOC142985933 [Anticarsia gemmatalis]|uniref:uncharacterized protein LOC142985933 n=1 Tax=Anticarsia gemmatalis TaxID=129554 RepID=UPI003F75AB13
MTIGKISAFDVNKDDWRLYIERLEQYYLVNEVKSELYVPTLITLMGAESYELLVNLCTPVKPKDKTFAQIVDVMEKHLQPKPSELAERYKFRKRAQQIGESIAEYVAILKKMTKSCEFGSWLEESLRDQLVCGICSETIRQRLFAEPKLDFARAYSLAISLESAEKDAASVVQGHERASGDTTKVDCHAIGDTRWRRRGAVAAGATGRKEEAHDVSGLAREAGPRGVRGNRQHQRARGPAVSAPAESAAQRKCAACGGAHAAATCRYCNVFADGLGRFTGPPVNISVRQGARPVYMRARPLAYALREPVERTLQQHVRDGILTPVERSDWATLIVPVLKKDGYVISEDGIHTCPNKVKAILDVQPPTNVAELRSFIGMIMVKEVLASSEVLMHYSAELPLVLTADASSVGEGAVMSQVTAAGERPVAYASRSLTAAECNYSQIDREALAIIYGIRNTETDSVVNRGENVISPRREETVDRSGDDLNQQLKERRNTIEPLVNDGNSPDKSAPPCSPLPEVTELAPKRVRKPVVRYGFEFD